MERGRVTPRRVGKALGVKALLALSLAALALVGCQFPQDTEGTTDRIMRDHVLRAGISESDPFVILEPGRPPAGSEVRLVERFARTLGARVEWVEGSEEENVDALKEGAIDVMASGLTSKSRWKKDVAFTRPYLTTEEVVGVPVGSSFPSDLSNVRVAAEEGSEEVGLAERKTKAIVAPVDQLEPGGPAAVGDWLLADLRLMPMTVLKKDKHVMAVKNGENELLVKLERFLLNRESQIRRLVDEEGRP
jgi:polar amino acid transport system substrate-binding protein